MFKIRQISCLILLLSFVCIIQPTAFAIQDLSQSSIDPTVVQEKIQLLGLRDDTLPYQQQPEYWLKERRLHILPELIAGLDNPEKRIAEGCLKLLTDVADSEKLYRVLVRIAADQNHPINKEAILALCDFPLDEPARKILQEALSDVKGFEDPRDRATIALALWRKPEAVDLISEFIENPAPEYQKKDAIEWLGDIGYPSAINLLENISESPEWIFAVEAYLSMDKIDPVGHGLTDTQKAFLVDSRKQGKWTQENQRAWWAGLTQYDKKEIRPFVIQMLHSNAAPAALLILQLWNDKEALPEIARMIRENEFVYSHHLREFLVAYVDIDGTKQSSEEAALILKEISEGRRKRVSRDETKFTIRELARSEIGRERKIEALTAIKTAIGPLIFAQSMEYLEVNEDSTDLILTFMYNEDDITALGSYARAVIRQKNNIAIPEIEAALEKLVSRDTLVEDEYYAARSILEACAAYKIENAGEQVNSILSSEWPLTIKMSAANVCSALKGNRVKGLELLYNGLSDQDASVRAVASGYLANIPCRGEQERIEREDVILSCIGLSCEDHALRLLTTCAGPRSIELLERILDEEDVSRAVYATWVLAQIKEDEDAQQKGLRRVAIYALFNKQTYQAGSGIDFNITSGLDFHQTISRLNPDTYPNGNLPVTIPRELLNPFSWDEKEQVFSIRAYRSMLLKRHYSDPVEFLRIYAIPNYPIERLDRTLLPLLRVIATEDPMLRIKFKQGNPIATFPNRKNAAKVIANITGDKMTYPGLKGEMLDSEQIPEQPYDKQNQRIAEFVLDHVQSAGFVEEPNTQKDWDRMEAYKYWINDLIRSVGPELKKALLIEAQQRGITEFLEKARFSIWIQQE